MSTARCLLSAILCRNWWVLLLRGLIAIAFGVLAGLLPGVTLATLELLVGVYALVDGLLGVGIALGERAGHEYWWALFLRGLVGVGVGILTFLAPAVTALALLFYIAVWAIATGLLEIVVAVRLWREIEGEWLFVLVGVASLVFGALFMAQPGAGALVLLRLIAAYAIVLGILLAIMALRARTFGR